jgi:hypothetical protein
MGQLGACLGFDFLGDAGNHAVKQVDMLVGIFIYAGEEQIGDAAEDFRLLARRSICESAFNLGDYRSLFRHGVRPIPAM